MTPASVVASKRDPRIDVLRGIALLMIFVDHIPANTLGLVTLHNFGFSDAAVYPPLSRHVHFTPDRRLDGLE
jgi:hypothetical protein